MKSEEEMDDLDRFIEEKKESILSLPRVLTKAMKILRSEFYLKFPANNPE